jgi:hypothetical protein
MLDKIIEVKVNRKELEKALNQMELFTEFKQTVEEFHVDEARLNEQQQYIENELKELQQKYTQNMLDQELANVAEAIYLRMETKKMTEKIEVLDSLLAEVKVEQQELLFTYYVKYRDALYKAGASASQYDFTPIFTKVIAETLAVAKEVGAEAEQQYKEVYPEISYIFFDNKVMERYPRIMETHRAGDYKPRFNWNEKTVLTKEQIQNAIQYRQMPSEFQLKEVAQDGE